MKKTAVRSIATVALAGAMSFGATTPAFALTHADDPMIPGDTITTTNDYTRGAATRAAMPSIEILGLASVEESGQFVDTSNYYNWAQPKYMLTASYYNEKLSPFLANLGTGKGIPGQYPAAVLDPARSGGGAGPNAALGSSADDNKVWALNPQLVVGTGGTGAAAYGEHGAVGVAYGFNDYSGLANTMDAIAAAVDDLENVQLRFRSTTATQIANDYREYIFGTMGAVVREIATTELETRNVVLVNGATFDDAEGDYVYTLLLTDGSDPEGTQDGTASSNRYLETTADPGIARLDTIANNYAEVCGTTVTADQLRGYLNEGQISLILVGGQQRAGDYTEIMTALVDDELIEHTYFVENNGSAGAQYGVVMNSVENAQNVGRILGMLYPEVVAQQDWIAYYYDHFYHINGSQLATVMANAMDGVRNAAVTHVSYTDDNGDYYGIDQIIDQVTDWSDNGGYTSSDAASNVAAKLADGYAWYLAAAASSETVE